MFPAADHHYGGVGFTGSPGIVAGSFAAGYGPVTLYGVADGDHIEVLGCAVSRPELARRPLWSLHSGRRWMPSTSSSSTGAGAPSSTRARLLTTWPRYGFALAPESTWVSPGEAGSRQWKLAPGTGPAPDELLSGPRDLDFQQA